jgi:hypothetical protein
MRLLLSKRQALLFTVAFILLYQGIAIANAGEPVMAVTCKVVPTIEVSFPDLLELGNAAPSSNTDESFIMSETQSVKVWSNTNWALKARSDSFDGRMRKWTSGEYSSESLYSPLELQVEGKGQFTSVTDEDTTIVENQPPTGEGGATLNLVFKQAISYNDSPIIESDACYRIEITFTAVQAY